MFLLRKCQRAFEGISSEWSFCIGAAVGVVFAPAALLLCLLFPRSRALWLATGTMLFLAFRFIPGLFALPEFEKVVDGKWAYGEYEIRIEDLRMTEAPDLERPRGVWAELLAFSCGAEKKKIPCRGKVLVFSNYPLPKRYGAVVTGRGTLLPPEEARPNSAWLLLTDGWKLKRYDKSWRSDLQFVRDILLERLTSSIIDDTNRNLAAAFYLGNTSGMNPERRRDFIAAGTVHLFAVSGLHVGMFALLLLLLFRVFPFRFRCFAAAAGVWGYVLLTGAAVPAVRAGFMIGLFLLCRGMLLTTPSLRLMGVAAGIIIITDPASLNAVGFHYSFLITAVLLLLSARLQELRQLEGRIFTIMPMTPENLAQRRMFNWGFACKSALISGIAAVLAGSVVSLYHNLALTPGAVAANWLTMPVLGFLFGMLPVKLLASSLSPDLDRWAAQIIELLFNYLRHVAEIMGDLAMPFYAFTPGVWLALVMTALLLAALALKNWKYAVASGTLFLLLFVSFPLRSFYDTSRVTVISSDSVLPPTVVISDKCIGELTVVNPVRGHHYDAEKAIKNSGASKISGIYFSAPSVRNLTALEYIERRYVVEKVFFPPMTGRNWKFKDRITESPGSYYCFHENENRGNLKIFRGKNKFAIEYPDSGAMLSWRLEISSGDNGRTVKLIRKGTVSSTVLPWSNKNGVWQHEL